jgi:hypothetical protein
MCQLDLRVDSEHGEIELEIEMNEGVISLK